MRMFLLALLTASVALVASAPSALAEEEVPPTSGVVEIAEESPEAPAAEAVAESVEVEADEIVAPIVVTVAEDNAVPGGPAPCAAPTPCAAPAPRVAPRAYVYCSPCRGKAAAPCPAPRRPYYRSRMYPGPISDFGR